MSVPGARDEPWFTDLYATHQVAVTRYGLRRLAGADSAGELAQEVFIVAWRRRQDVPDQALPWLYGVARRLLANQRRTRRPVPSPEVDIAVAGGADLVTTVADLRVALTTLTEDDQEILRLVGWEELTVAEAAVVVGCSRATAAVRLHRVRRRLGAAMTAYDRPGTQPRTVLQ
ncbi:RNA polymerase sigma factor [Micromonosporaceae bacterium Da 78-11]